jgi:ribosomal protein S9
MPKVTLDRFEEELAVLIVDGREVTRPRAELPPEAREGDVLDLDTLKVDPRATERLRAEVRRARKRAQKNKTPPPGNFDL